MLVRFFAGAAEAAGVDEVEVAEGVTDGRALVAALAHDNDRLGRVLAVSSLLADGVRITDLAAPLGSVERVDVLPPFAGG